MRQIKVVSIDIFGTLVDLRNAGHVFWRMLLKDRYTVELAEECYAHLGNSWFEYAPEEKFLSVKSIFVKGFAGLFSSIDIEFDPAATAIRGTIRIEPEQVLWWTQGNMLPQELLEDATDVLVSLANKLESAKEE